MGQEWSAVQVAAALFALRNLRPYGVLEVVMRFWGAAGIRTVRLLNKEWDAFVRKHVPVCLRISSPEHVSALSAALARLTVPRAVVASGLRLKGAAFAPVVHCVESSCGTLERLNVEFNMLERREMQDVVAALGAGAPKLRHLGLRANRGGGGWLPALTAVLPACPALETLTLGRSEVRAVDMEALLPALQACQHLTTLDLGSNTLTQPAVAALVAALPALPSLRSLDLGNCDLPPNSVRDVVEALAECKLPLDSLDLGNNGLDGAGVPAVLAHMPYWAVKEVSFLGNPLPFLPAADLWEAGAAVGCRVHVSHSTRYQAGAPPQRGYGYGVQNTPQTFRGTPEELEMAARSRGRRKHGAAAAAQAQAVGADDDSEVDGSEADSSSGGKQLRRSTRKGRGRKRG